MQPIQLFDPESSTYSYLLIDPATRDALLIDPVDDQMTRDLATLQSTAQPFAGWLKRTPMLTTSPLRAS
jgi:hypothetical protein